MLLTPVAGPIFETKNRAIFLERFFGRGITAREHLSRAKNSLDFKSSCNLVIWIESCWLPTREGNYCRNVFSSWKRRNTPRFRTLLFGKEAVKTFFYKCSNSAKMNPLHSQVMEQSCRAVMLLPKFLSRKISQEKSLDFLSQKSVVRPA